MSIKQYIQREVERIKPGEQLQFDALLFDWPTFPPATPIDDVLGGIVGSAYEYSWEMDAVERVVTIRRRESPLTSEEINAGLRCSVSSDRMASFERIGDLYQMIKIL